MSKQGRQAKSKARIQAFEELQSEEQQAKVASGITLADAQAVIQFAEQYGGLARAKELIEAVQAFADTLVIAVE